jgi:hypothetical protein
MSLAEVCALLTVIIGLLTLMVTVVKAAFDAGRKISNKEHDKKKNSQPGERISHFLHYRK